MHMVQSYRFFCCKATVGIKLLSFAQLSINLLSSYTYVAMYASCKSLQEQFFVPFKLLSTFTGFGSSHDSVGSCDSTLHMTLLQVCNQIYFVFQFTQKIKNSYITRYVIKLHDGMEKHLKEDWFTPLQKH